MGLPERAGVTAPTTPPTAMTADDTTRSDGQDSIAQIDQEKLLTELQKLREGHLMAASAIGSIQHMMRGGDREQ